MQKILRSQLLHAQEVGLLSMLTNSAIFHQLKPAYVVAVASRETSIRNVAGDGGHGRGVLQIDDRYHDIARTTDFRAHPGVLIEYGCELLQSNLTWARTVFKGMSDFGLIKLATSAYNCGRGGARRGHDEGDSDAHTTGGDYAKDVLERMRIFEQLLTEIV